MIPTHIYPRRTVALAVLGCAVLLAACGSSSSKHSASASRGVKYADCVRAHGVPNFPDPTGNNEETYQLIGRLGIDPKSPAFGHAAARAGTQGCLVALQAGEPAADPVGDSASTIVVTRPVSTS